MPKIIIEPQINTIINSWFPWVTNENCDIIDRNLARKIASGHDCLIMPEIITVLRWYGAMPVGFRSEYDECVASMLLERIG